MKKALTRIGAATGGMFLAFGVSAVLASPASAEVGDVEPIAAEGCVYAGQQYSEGALIQVGDRYIKCVFGSWQSA